MRNTLEVTNFYKFFPIDRAELAVKKLSLEARAAKVNLSGLVIIAEEGCNGTVCGDFEAISFFEQSLPILFENTDWTFKRAYAISEPFKDFRVKVRPEIVTSHSDISVGEPKNHLSPEEWQAVLDGEDEFVMLDVRNKYETMLGGFRGAIDPQTEHFSQFAAVVRGMQIPKEKKVLIYCTGGIRCEKAVHELERQGYQNTFQLQGGILNYLERFPHRDYEGECFVFDGRVAVDQNLNPSRKWFLCPHCGQPGQKHIECNFCTEPAVICDDCSGVPERITCSHDCAYKSVHHPSRLSANA